MRTSSEVGDRLGLPLLARIPPPPKAFSKDDRLVMLAQPTGTNAETFRMLRTNLDFAMLEHEGPRTVLVTSAIEGEGKSTTAANLAVAEARAGRRVALVDLDLRVPYLDRFFGLTHAQGITDVALGNIELGAALRRIDLGTGAPLPPATEYTSGTNGHATDEGALDVLVSGPRPPDPGEFVNSRRLAEILRRLSESYDVVIIDTPPILRVGDAMALSARASGILVITKLTVARRSNAGGAAPRAVDVPGTVTRLRGYRTSRRQGQGIRLRIRLRRLRLQGTAADREAARLGPRGAQRASARHGAECGHPLE